MTEAENWRWKALRYLPLTYVKDITIPSRMNDDISRDIEICYMTELSPVEC